MFTEFSKIDECTFLVSCTVYETIVNIVFVSIFLSLVKVALLSLLCYCFSARLLCLLFVSMCGCYQLRLSLLCTLPLLLLAHFVLAPNEKCVISLFIIHSPFFCINFCLRIINENEKHTQINTDVRSNETYLVFFLCCSS